MAILMGSDHYQVFTDCDMSDDEDERMRMRMRMRTGR